MNGKRLENRLIQLPPCTLQTVFQGLARFNVVAAWAGPGNSRNRKIPGRSRKRILSASQLSYTKGMPLTCSAPHVFWHLAAARARRARTRRGMSYAAAAPSKSGPSRQICTRTCPSVDHTCQHWSTATAGRSVPMPPFPTPCPVDTPQRAVPPIQYVS